MVTTLLTGATGTLGTALRPRLRDDGHDVRAASRSPPAGGDGGDGDADDGDDGAADDGGVEWVELDLTDGTGVDEAVSGVDVVVHAASDATGDSEAVDVRGTERLLAAAAEADVSNFLYVSIVGVDEIPFSYYEHKYEAERAVEASEVPSTILRATQFHDFIAELLGMVAWLPVWPLPTKWKSQPIDVGEAADAVVERATTEAHGRVPDVGGPEVYTLGDLARGYKEARGLRRLVVPLPIPGKMSAGFREGKATCPDRAVGTVTWEEWLAAEYE